MSTPTPSGSKEQNGQPKESQLTPSELEAQQHRRGIEEKAEVLEHGDENWLHGSTANSIVVDWDGENDPANPMNWSKAKRISQVVLVSAITMVTLVLISVSSLPLFANESATVHLRPQCWLQGLSS